MAAYHARTQFSGSQEGIVLFAVLRLRASLASQQGGWALPGALFFWRTREQKRCGNYRRYCTRGEALVDVERCLHCHDPFFVLAPFKSALRLSVDTF